MSDTRPSDELDRETLLEQLRVARNRLAIAEAQLALSRIPAPPRWEPGTAQARELADRLGALGPALDVLFHTAKTSMLLVAPDTTILRANQGAAELFGIPVSQLPGLRTLDLTIDDEVAETTAAMAEIAGGRFMVKSYRRPDGATVQALSMGWPLVDDEGEVICLLGVNVPLERVAIARATAELLIAEYRRQPEAEGPPAEPTADPAVG